MSWLTLAEREGIFLILDGLGDRGIGAFDGRTPLEASHTPNMDRLISGSSAVRLNHGSR